MGLAAKLKNLPIRLKLLYGYLMTFLFIICIGNAFLYFYIRGTIKENIESELSNITSSILNMVTSTVHASVNNHLRAIAEKNLEIISGIYQRQLTGELTEKEAKTLAAQILGSQTLGKTGYLYCINSQGIIQVHSNHDLIGANLSKYDFINLQKKRRSGYLEYEWANPGEQESRPKALYMRYFGPWDWIISASSYRDEFNSLIKIDELRTNILSIRFGKTGYPYVMDSKGVLLIHPKLEGTNIFDSEDSDGHKFIQEICKKKNGSIIYPWQNPGEARPRPKLVFFNYIEELDWIVASSSYLEEFYQPLKTLNYLTALSVLLMITVTLPLTWFLSGSITKPLKELMIGLESVANGDFSKRLVSTGDDEVGCLSRHFNATVDQLEDSNAKLHDSERNLRSVFNNSIEGIFLCDPDGRFYSANPSCQAMLGLKETDLPLETGLNFQEDVLADGSLWEKLIKLLQQERAVKSFELQIKQKNGGLIWCILNARAIQDPKTDDIIRIEGFLTDINDLKIAEKAQRAIQEELENRVEERTAELTGWVTHLKLQDIQNRLVHEMADMLQTCRTTNETFPVIGQYLQTLFPGDDCSLYLFDEDQHLLDRRVPVRKNDESMVSILPEDCWAIRLGKPYQYNSNNSHLLCDHITSAPSGYLCIPLLAHGITTGMLHLDLKKFEQEQTSTAEKETFDRKLKLCIRLTEHLSLALANLKMREELEQLSLKDSLTGLSNRRHMDDILHRQLLLQKRHGMSFSLLMLDVDHFKIVNDTYGHDTGDTVLKTLANYLKNESRKDDLCCRYGGEEFLLILAGIDPVHAKKRADRLLTGIASELKVATEEKQLNITVSIGVASCPEQGNSINELLKAADSALYKAKKNGRNRVELAGK